MPDPSTERVLGVPTARLRLAGMFQGFRPFDPAAFAFLLDPAHLEYRLRSSAELDPTFKQLIPYVVLRCGEQVFHYTRGAGGNEARLRAKRSIGVGGHISFGEDAGAAGVMGAGMLRELTEEVELGCEYRETMLGLINDDSTPVGEVHLGVVHLFELASASATPREAGLANAGFASLSELRERASEFETWSQLAFEVLG